MAINIGRHKNILIELLKALYNDATIAPLLAFKGGTAAQFIYNLPRFSVDLDFDLLDPSKEEYVFERVKAIIEKFGSQKDAMNKRYTIFFRLSYAGKMDGEDNVKVEINKRSSGSKYSLSEPYGIPMLVMVKEDMAANKLVAMYNRLGEANRDIFDVWFFLKNSWPVNKEIVEQRTGFTYKEFLEKCIEALKGINRKHILDGLGELLTDKQKVWVKSSLIDEVLLYLRLAIENEQPYSTLVE